jgi:hypothetical protein
MRLFLPKLSKAVFENEPTDLPNHLLVGGYFYQAFRIFFLVAPYS